MYLTTHNPFKEAPATATNPVLVLAVTLNVLKTPAKLLTYSMSFWYTIPVKEEHAKMHQQKVQMMESDTCTGGGSRWNNILCEHWGISIESRDCSNSSIIEIAKIINVAIRVIFDRFD